jgi:hypothetical protein
MIIAAVFIIALVYSLHLSPPYNYLGVIVSTFGLSVQIAAIVHVATRKE